MTAQCLLCSGLAVHCVFERRACLCSSVPGQCVLGRALVVQRVFARCNTVRGVLGSVRGYCSLHMNTLEVLSGAAVCAVGAPSEILLQIAVCVVNDALQVLPSRSVRCVRYAR